MNNMNYSIIGARVQHISQQLRNTVGIKFELCFNNPSNDYWFSIEIFNENCYKSFGAKYKSIDDLFDSIMSYCIERDLFEIPLTISIE